MVVNPELGFRLFSRKLYTVTWSHIAGNYILWPDLRKSYTVTWSHIKTLNSELYRQQLNRLKKAIAQKWLILANRGGIMFHQDNARQHTSTPQWHSDSPEARELDLEVFMHLSYISNLAVYDYHLFLLVTNWRLTNYSKWGLNFIKDIKYVYFYTFFHLRKIIERYFFY